MLKHLRPLLLAAALITAGVLVFVQIRALKQADTPLIITDKTEMDLSKFKKLDDWLTTKRSASDSIQIVTATQENNEVTLVAVGDIMLSRVVGNKMKEKNDPNFPFLKTQPLISNADFAFGNLETPIMAGVPVSNTTMVFRADPEAAKGLAWAGFDMLNLANNHALNQGREGLLSTFKILKENNITYYGALENTEQSTSVLQIHDLGGVRVGLLGYSYGTPDWQATKTKSGIVLMNEAQLKQDLAFARPQVDYLIVTMHDGVEYDHKSSPEQQAFARLSVDNGADLVIGHHPHVVQELEQYKGKPIYYSLGNFVFDQDWSEATKQGLALQIKLTKQGLENITPVPIVIESYGQPRLADEAEGARILKYLER